MSLVKLLCMVAGTRQDARAKAPLALAQAATFGALLLLTATVASVTCAYALYRAFTGDAYAAHVAVGGGLLWGGIVFLIDRSMLLGIDKFAGPWGLSRQALIRVPLAVVIGIAISKPIVLRVAQTVLDAELRKESRAALSGETTVNARMERTDEHQSNVAEFQEARQAQESRMRKEPDEFEYGRARAASADAAEHHREVSRTNTVRISGARREVASISSSDRLQDSFSRRRLQILRGQIDRWNTEIRVAEREADAAKALLDEAAAKWLARETAKLTAIEHQLATARKDAGVSMARVAERNVESEAALRALMRPNLVNEFTMMKRIQADRSHPQSAAMRALELALDAVFILLELTPMLLKLMSRLGTLDHATAAVEFEDRERINLAANSTAVRLQKATEVGTAVDCKAMEIWGDGTMGRLQQTATLTPLYESSRGERLTSPDG